MKNSIAVVILFLIAVFYNSCSNDDKTETIADYSVLGLKSLVINGQEVSVKNGGLLETTEFPFIVIDGTSYNKATKQAQLFYSVLISPKTTPSVTLSSSYTDASVTIDKEEAMSVSTYTVKIRREGYQEELSYVIKFVPNSILSN